MQGEPSETLVIPSPNPAVHDNQEPISAAPSTPPLLPEVESKEPTQAQSATVTTAQPQPPPLAGPRKGHNPRLKVFCSSHAHHPGRPSQVSDEQVVDVHLITGDHVWETRSVPHLYFSAVLHQETSSWPDMRIFRAIYTEIGPDATILMWTEYI